MRVEFACAIFIENTPLMAVVVCARLLSLAETETSAFGIGALFASVTVPETICAKDGIAKTVKRKIKRRAAKVRSGKRKFKCIDKISWNELVLSPAFRRLFARAKKSRLKAGLETRQPNLSIHLRVSNLIIFLSNVVVSLIHSDDFAFGND